jgi:hypothetical protein
VNITEMGKYFFSLASAIGEKLDKCLDGMGNYNFSVGYTYLVSI